MAPQVPDFSREVIVTSIGITIVQALDSIANEMKLTDVDIQALWSPFLAATTRLVKPADEMVATFLRESKTENVKKAISNEIHSPQPEFYAPFNQSLQNFLRTLTESVRDISYLAAVENQGIVDKRNMAADVMEMLNYYFDDQNSKGRKIQPTDEAFRILLCTVLPQHVEDVMRGNRVNGIKNTGELVEKGQVVFGTALLLQMIIGMLE
jgi:hypothetical protein